MGAEHERECFNNPLILYSEHKRVLGDAIKRGDEKTRDAEWRGMCLGFAFSTVPILIAAVSGFLYGLSFVQ
jgi:hypothetical protein